MGVIELIGIPLQALLANRAALALENLALRQQPAVLERAVKGPALEPSGGAGVFRAVCR